MRYAIKEGRITCISPEKIAGEWALVKMLREESMAPPSRRRNLRPTGQQWDPLLTTGSTMDKSELAKGVELEPAQNRSESNRGAKLPGKKTGPAFITP